MRRAIWWAAGCAVAAVPVVAAIWTANRDAPFYPVLACVAAVGAVAAMLHLRRPATERQRVESIPPSLAFAVAYPLSAAIGVVAAADDVSTPAALIVLAAGAAVAAVPLVVRRVSSQPARRFRMLMVFWIVVAWGLVDGLHARVAGRTR